VRIAGEVIQEELVEKGDTTKLQSLIKLAKEKNRITIVPMIEEAQTLAQIWPMGIDYVQGYYLSPPSPNLYFDFSEARL
jgi:EAL domain-containing protein (putative c-di-GMP-specific phosphodiesterase class I)